MNVMKDPSYLTYPKLDICLSSVFTTSLCELCQVLIRKLTFIRNT